MRAKIISINNHKGGVGKTTITLNMAYYFAEQGKRVLAVDMDAQGNLTFAFGQVVLPSDNSVSNVLFDDLPIKKAIRQVRTNLDVLGANLTLSNIDIELNTKLAREYTLKNALDEVIEEYDYIIVDCPPSIGQATINALACSDYYISVTQPHLMAVHGLLMVTNIVDNILNKINKDLHHLGIILNFFDERTTLAKRILSNIEEVYEDKVFKTKIKNLVAIAEAPIMAQSIFEYSPATNASNNFVLLYDEVLNRIEKHEKKLNKTK